VVQCADDLVFSPVKSTGVAALVHKYSRFGLMVESVEMPVPGERDAVYQGISIRLRERPITPSSAAG
jgi:hypothetical protein